MAVITMRQMLEAGVHFGHQTRRWNPKMKRFIFGERNGIYIIDLEQTLTRVERAYAYVRDLVANGGVILFVGTKKQAQDPVRSYAEKCGMPFVNERWLGGMLTNFDTISKRVGKMLEYERMRDSGEFDAMPKKEALILSRELEKLQRNLGGLRGLNRKPDAIFVLDTKKEHIAVTEANKLGIPVVAVVDTNVDPELVQYPIPGNDDAIRANSLLARVIADAVEEGRFINAKRDRGPAATARSTEEEAQFNAQQAAARREAVAAQAARERRLEAATSPAATDEATSAERSVPATAPDFDHGVLGAEASSGTAAPIAAESMSEPEVAPIAAESVSETAVAPIAAESVSEPEVAPIAAESVSETAVAPLAAESVSEPEVAPIAAESVSETAAAPETAPPGAAVSTPEAAAPAAAESTSEPAAAPDIQTSAAEATPETAEPALGGAERANAPAEPGDEPYGPGSARAAEDGSGPTAYDIKANADSRLYHVPGSRYFDATVADVWFETVEHAEAAGFTAPESA